MLSTVLLTLLPAVVYAHISVRVQAGKSMEQSCVMASGYMIDIIPYAEIASWSLDDNRLKDAVKAYSGGRPQDAFLKSPTPWNDLYTSNGWPQVQRTLTVSSAKILRFSSQPVTVVIKEVYNNCSEPSKFKEFLKYNFTENISSSWNKGAELKLVQNIDYSMNLLIGLPNMFTSYSAAWGQEISRTKNFTLIYEAYSSLDILPGCRAKVSLKMYRALMEIEIKYQASLKGGVACHYRKRYKGHYFWSYDVNDCLKAADSSTVLYSSEIIKVDFYYSLRFVVSDAETSNELFSAPGLLKM